MKRISACQVTIKRCDLSCEGTLRRCLSQGDLEPLPPYGVRLLRQDPFETLLGFLCSQNNHQKRIASMVNSLCSEYGDYIGTCPAGVRVCAFPNVEQLQRCSEVRLRELGFGYRAKFIAKTATAMKAQLSRWSFAGAAADTATDWGRLLTLAGGEASRSLLIELPGVGRKVADCILLFAFNRVDIVPIDTHMAQITAVAAASSAPQMTKATKRTSAKTEATTVKLTPKIHAAYQSHYFSVFGTHAGWAHCFLFAPRLTTSSVALPH